MAESGCAPTLIPRNYVMMCVMSTDTEAAATSPGESRLQKLERRLDALEAAVFQDGAREAVALPEPAGDRYWALAGLKARTGGRSVVLFTGHVEMEGAPVYEWQQGAAVDGLLAMDVDGAAGALAALGHPARLRLLQAVLGGRRSSGELGALEGHGTSGQLYHHLRELQAAGWLRSAGRGTYEVPPARVIPLLTALAAARP